jgi:protoporphyrinogen oxidase
MRVGVIGAGPAGLAAAYQLSKAHYEVEVYEASGAVGGMARSIHLWGQTVDLGPHRFFSRDRRVNELWLDVVGQGGYGMVKRRTHILYQGKLLRYPLEAFDALTKMGIIEAVRCLSSYAFSRKNAKLDSGDRTKNGSTQDASATFEDWVSQRFGRRLFEIFFKTYSEKLWGIPCHELDADFAAQRIKKFSLSEAIKNALNKNGNTHRTLVDEFAYPFGGTGMVYERIAERVRNNGGRIFLNKPVRRIVTERNGVVGLEFEDGTSQECEHIVSTMPLTLLVERIPHVPTEVIEASRRLTFRNTILVYLEIKNLKGCEDQWIYVHSPGLQTGRITNFRNWVPQLCGSSSNTILAMEYWCNDTDDMWRADDIDLINLARKEILLTRLVSDVSQIQNGAVYRIPRCYPVYRRGYQEQVRVIQQFLRTISGLQIIGRYGSFKYNNQDHSILMGILAAENICGNRGHDLWTVNADYDTYQEGCRISETGLIPLGVNAK